MSGTGYGMQGSCTERKWCWIRVVFPFLKEREELCLCN